MFVATRFDALCEQTQSPRGLQFQLNDSAGDGGPSLALPDAPALRRIITVSGGGGDASFASSADSDGAMSEKTHKV